MRRACLVALVALLSVAMGCVSPEDRKPLAARQGARELRCPEARLTVKQVGDRLFRVSGCGRQATYRVICKLTVGSCYLIGGPDAG